MLLVVDAGNTNTVFAVFDGDSLVGRWRILTEKGRTSDEYVVLLSCLLGGQGIESAQVDAAIISTVVPQGLFALESLCRNYFKTTPLVVGSEGVDVGIDVLVDKPCEVGADRLVNAVAAFSMFKEPCIVVDFGTATTFDVTNDKGDYIGGVIAPGVNLSMRALHQAAAKLPDVAISKPDKALGKSTSEAMKAGIYWGYIGLVDSVVSRIKLEVGGTMKSIATGGLASLFSGSSQIDCCEEDLTIWGLKKIFEINR